MFLVIDLFAYITLQGIDEVIEPRHDVILTATCKYIRENTSLVFVPENIGFFSFLL